MVPLYLRAMPFTLERNVFETSLANHFTKAAPGRTFSSPLSEILPANIFPLCDKQKDTLTVPCIYSFFTITISLVIFFVFVNANPTDLKKILFFSLKVNFPCILGSFHSLPSSHPHTYNQRPG